MATYARAKSIKDTWITSKSVTSNFGASPILEVWTRWNDNTQKKDMARILIQFALSSLYSSIVNKGSIPDPRTTYCKLHEIINYLRLDGQSKNLMD